MGKRLGSLYANPLKCGVLLLGEPSFLTHASGVTTEYKRALVRGSNGGCSCSLYVALSSKNACSSPLHASCASLRWHGFYKISRYVQATLQATARDLAPLLRELTLTPVYGMHFYDTPQNRDRAPKDSERPPYQEFQGGINNEAHAP